MASLRPPPTSVKRAWRTARGLISTRWVWPAYDARMTESTLDFRPLTPERFGDLVALFEEGGDPKWCWYTPQVGTAT